MKNLKYWVLILFISIIPTVILHLMVKPLWTDEIESFMIAATIDGMLTSIFLPIYLTVVNYHLSRKFEIHPYLFVVNALIVLSCIWLSAYLSFENWTNSIGNKSNSYYDTLELIGLERTLGFIISIVILVIAPATQDITFTGDTKKLKSR